MVSKRWICSGVLAACVGFSLPFAVFAQSAVPAAPIVVVPVTVQPFVGIVAADRVNIRSGPEMTYYEVGQLHNGDMVNVTGQRQGWYEITPPLGTYALVAKEFVDADAGGTSGTVKADPVLNVRAGSAMAPSSDYAVIGKVTKGTKVTILGTTDKYYKITPPAGSVLWVSPQYVKPAPAGSTYEASTITMPGAVLPAPAPPAVAAEPATGPGVVVIRPPGEMVEVPGTMAATMPAAATQTAAVPATNPGPTVAIPPLPVPPLMVTNDAYAKFTDLNTRTQAEMQKPVMDRNIEGLLKEYQDLAAGPNVPPSVKQGIAARVDLLQSQMKVQALAKEDAGGQALDDQRKALERQWADAQKRVNEMETSSPPLAVGLLKTSTTLEDKYVLVDPTTGRVAAYVDPSSEIDLSKLLGQYVGVRGSYTQDATLGIRAIKVKTATMMAEPKE